MPPYSVAPSCTSCFEPAGRELHGGNDFGICRAATEIAGEILPDLIIVGIGMRVEELSRHQHEARRAETALRRAGFEERLLDRRELPVLGEPLDGRDLLAVRESRKIEAAGHGGA